VPGANLGRTEPKIARRVHEGCLIIQVFAAEWLSISTVYAKTGTKVVAKQLPSSCGRWPTGPANPPNKQWGRLGSAAAWEDAAAEWAQACGAATHSPRLSRTPPDRDTAPTCHFLCTALRLPSRWNSAPDLGPTGQVERGEFISIPESDRRRSLEGLTMTALLQDYLPLVIFIGVAVVIGLALLVAPFVVAFKQPDPEKLSAYECGFNAFDDARMKFDVRYYLVAILFIIFDLEVSFLFPWAVAFGKLGLYGFWSMMIFLGVLTIGFIYEWKKGALEWD
jgi:NADH-quinone oxidoreductase subunit A